MLNLDEFSKNKFKGTLKNCLNNKQDILVGDSMLNNELLNTVWKGTVDSSNYDFGKLLLKEKWQCICDTVHISDQWSILLSRKRKVITLKGYHGLSHVQWKKTIWRTKYSH